MESWQLGSSPRSVGTASGGDRLLCLPPAAAAAAAAAVAVAQRLVSKACIYCISAVSRICGSEVPWFLSVPPLCVVLRCAQQPSPLPLPSPTKFALGARSYPLFLCASPGAQHQLSFAPTAAPCSFPVGRITSDFGQRTHPPTTGGPASTSS